MEVKPGITGLWQILARQESSFESYIKIRSGVHRKLVSVDGPENYAAHDSSGALWNRHVGSGVCIAAFLSNLSMSIMDTEETKNGGLTALAVGPVKNGEFRRILGISFFVGSATEAVSRMKKGGCWWSHRTRLKDMTANTSCRDALLNADLAIADSGFMVLVWNWLEHDSILKVSGLESSANCCGSRNFDVSTTRFGLWPATSAPSEMSNGCAPRDQCRSRGYVHRAFLWKWE